MFFKGVHCNNRSQKFPLGGSVNSLQRKLTNSAMISYIDTGNVAYQNTATNGVNSSKHLAAVRLNTIVSQP